MVKKTENNGKSFKEKNDGKLISIIYVCFAAGTSLMRLTNVCIL